jgi:hypothetical protein
MIFDVGVFPKVIVMPSGKDEFSVQLFECGMKAMFLKLIPTRGL